MQNLAVKPPTPRHVPITVEIYHLMAEKGAFGPEDRVELIGGKIFDMSPIGSLHARCVNFLNAFLGRVLQEEYILNVQNPIILDDESEPEPDLAVLRHVADFYKDELPGAGEVKLIIEIADSSVEFDRNIKLRRYAMAGIAESWLIDLINERVEVHTRPEPDGYAQVKVFRRGENAVSATLPSIDLPVDDIFG